jgi:CheY-like chemotaxis protein
MSRILAIDDNPVNLRLVTLILQKEGYVVDNAVDAEQALEMLEHTVPDLILVDIALPGMDGLTLTRKLKADARFKSIPTVALTAFAMKGDDQKAYDAGCDDYITKPIDTRQFPRQIARWLGAHPPFRGKQS